MHDLAHFHDALRTHFERSADVKRRTIDVCGEAILEAAHLVAEAFRTEGKLLLCGNGGSAADCQHMAAEFTSRLSKDFVRPGLPAIALTCDASFVTAFANDFGFDGVFARGVQSLGRPGDVVIGISTSGNSPNVLLALETAKRLGLGAIALTGEGGGRMADVADVTIAVPSDVTAHVQEAHLAIEHVICHVVERAVFGEHGAGEWKLAA